MLGLIQDPLRSPPGTRAAAREAAETLASAAGDQWEWLTWAQCNQGTKTEAKEMERRKFPPRARPPGPRPRPRGAADRSHLRRGAGSPPAAIRRRLQMADGRRVPVDRGPGTTPVPLGPTPEGVYGRGAGRSARGLPIEHRVGVTGGGRASRGAACGRSRRVGGVRGGALPGRLRGRESGGGAGWPMRA